MTPMRIWFDAGTDAPRPWVLELAPGAERLHVEWVAVHGRCFTRTGLGEGYPRGVLETAADAVVLWATDGDQKEPEVAAEEVRKAEV